MASVLYHSKIYANWQKMYLHYKNVCIKWKIQEFNKKSERDTANLLFRKLWKLLIFGQSGVQLFSRKRNWQKKL